MHECVCRFWIVGVQLRVYNREEKSTTNAWRAGCMGPPELHGCGRRESGASP